MSTIHVEVSDVIKARPEQVYAVLSDYRMGHPAILPKPYFTSLTVDEGGQGAGTRIQVHMKVLGALNGTISSLSVNQSQDVYWSSRMRSGRGDHDLYS